MQQASVINFQTSLVLPCVLKCKFISILAHEKAATCLSSLLLTSRFGFVQILLALQVPRGPHKAFYTPCLAYFALFSQIHS